MGKLLLPFWFVASACLWGGGVAEAEDTIEPRIINGNEISPSNADFFVALMFEFSWDGLPAGSHWNPFCGASYLGDGIIVTAAHCVESIPVGGAFSVLLGNNSADMEYEYCNNSIPQHCKTDPVDDATISGYHYTGYVAYTGNSQIEVTRTANTVSIHPAYSPYQNDIALIKTANIAATATNTLVIPDNDVWPGYIGNKVRVIGHGDTLSDNDSSTSEPSADLMYADVTAKADSACISDYGGSYDGEVMVCAGDPNAIDPNLNGLDSCQGDSGGPLYDSTNEVLLGIVSWGGQCAKYNGVYSDVHALSSWVNAGRANLLNLYAFPQQVDFGTGVETLSNTLEWTFKNESSGDVTLTEFGFSSLNSAYSVNSENCNGATLANGNFCTVVLTANFTTTGTYQDAVGFKVDGEPMEFFLFAKVNKKTSNRFGSTGGSFSPGLLLLAIPLLAVRGRRCRQLVLASFAVIGLGACASSAARPGAPEVIYNPVLDEAGLAFSVVSTGCTLKEDLVLQTSDGEIEVRRTREDLCRMAPHLVRFVLPLPQREAAWRVRNPVRYSNRIELEHQGSELR